jgi:hypothetical protein
MTDCRGTREAAASEGSRHLAPVPHTQSIGGGFGLRGPGALDPKGACDEGLQAVPGFSNPHTQLTGFDAAQKEII